MGTSTLPWQVKQARATELNRELATSVDAYIASEVEVVWSYDDASGDHLARLRMSSPPPPRLGAIVGDIVKNLRSALDSRIYAILAPRCAEAPQFGAGGWKSASRMIHYPVAQSVNDFRSVHQRSWHQGVADPDLMRVVESTQPYWLPTQGTMPLKGEALQESIKHDWLTQLAHLSNVDKHHSVLTTVSYVDMVWIGTPEETKTKFFVGDRPPFVDGSLILHARVDADPRHVSPNGSVSVALEQDWGLLHGTPAVGRAAGFMQRVDWVVALLDEYCRRNSI